jgi:molybdate transport system substrate-binding protein
VRHRRLAVIVSALLVLVVVSAVLYVFLTRNDNSNVITRTVPGAGGAGGATGAGGGDGGDANTISIYAPSELSKILERVTTAYQRERPGTTFQFTLGPTADLAERIRNGQTPSIYVDTNGAIAKVPPKVKATAAPVPFGYDIVQLAVKKGNPKQVNGLNAFGSGSPMTTGICATQLPCGWADAQALQGAGVSAAPKVIASNPSELTDGVKSGQIDAILLLRTDLRAAITAITNVAIPPQSTIRVEYQMLKFKTGGPADDFVNWMQGSPSARQVLRLAGMLSFYDG